MADVFISYSRRDKEFVARLHATLLSLNRSAWVDWQEILPTEQWWQAIEAGIEAANAFIFVISPDSVSSAVCRQEVEHAIRCGKRLVPIVWRDADAKAVHPVLSAHNWIFMRSQDDFETSSQTLVTALDTDLDYVRSHTRLLMRALEWEREGYDPSFLLRGKDLVASERWLKRSTNKKPVPSDLQVQYILTSRKSPYYKPKLKTVVPVSFVVTILLMGVRLTGIFQPLELALYDHLMRSRPSAKQPDPRVVVVQITEADIQAQRKQYRNASINDRGAGTIPDITLERLLEKLLRYQPRMIGLDIYRDTIPAVRPQLATLLKQSDRIITVCKHSDGSVPGVEPPPEVASDQIQRRVGFSDLSTDPDRQIVRRQLLSIRADPDFCNVDMAFSLAIAREYLAVEGQAYIHPFSPTGEYLEALRFGDTPIRQLVSRFSAGYQGVDTAGYQTLLNYQTYNNSPKDFIRSFSLAQALDNKNDGLLEKEVRDKVVLIGISSSATANDYFVTPYGELPGVILQAQMVSHLLGVVIDERPQIWWGSWIQDFGWVWAWSLVGGLLVWRWQRPINLMIAGGVSLLCLYSICYWIFVGYSGWLLLLPPAIALILTGSTELYITGLLSNLKKKGIKS